MAGNRVDIQALRGWAVLLVLLHHAKLGVLGAGFLGVDIFFVISGFLITGLIARSIKAGNFSFRTFYLRRAKRLLPAAYVTLLATALLAPVFLSQLELHDLRTQIWGALSFSANMVLWQQTGYFQGAGDLKPLLHFWSLAIEEQYYMLLPALLVWAGPRRWWPISIACVLLSLALCAWMSTAKPIAGFYLLPSRAWELGFGSLGALMTPGPRLRQTLQILFCPALLALVLLPVLAQPQRHPGLEAVAVCAATWIVIMRGHPAASTQVWVQPMAWMGDMSYSLYLVHWPIFSFLSNAWLGHLTDTLPLPVRLGAVAASLLLGWSMYRWVERPVREARMPTGKAALGPTLAFSALIAGVLPVLAMVRPPPQDFAYLRRVNSGLSEHCGDTASYTAPSVCRTSDAPELLVWGDSFAAHLVPGFVGPNAKLVQATRGNCGPMLGFAPMRRDQTGDGLFTVAWSRDCQQFNRSVLAYLQATPSLRVVVLSSQLNNYLDGAKFKVIAFDAEGEAQRDAGPAVALAGLQRTVAAVRAMGRKVVFVAPPPYGDFDTGRCVERARSRQFSVGAPPDCALPVASYQQQRADLLTLLDLIERRADVGLIRFEPQLCDAVRCLPELDGTLLYRDYGHLTHEGIVLLAQRMQLSAQVERLAR